MEALIKKNARSNSFDYNYWVAEHWAIGLHTDMIITWVFGFGVSKFLGGKDVHK